MSSNTWGVEGRRTVPARIPPALAVAGAWAWRLVFLAAAAYIVLRVLRRLGLLVLPLILALLLATLLRPVAAQVRRVMPGPLAALVTLLVSLAALTGIGYFVVLRAVRGMPELVDQFAGTVQGLREKLQGLTQDVPALDRVAQGATEWLQRHRSQTIEWLTTGAGYTVEAIATLLLTVFITFFLLYDAERIWSWLLRMLPGTAQARVDRAGQVAWSVITGYVRGTVAIAAIHGTVIGLVLVVLGTPLAAPLAVLVFFGSFVPLIGALLAGGLAVLATFGTVGWLPALVLFGVLIAENQLEAHVLQPLIMGHNVQLHPLAIGLTVTAGTLLGGIFGALVAVPVVAIVYRTAPVLFDTDDSPSPPPEPDG